VQDVGRQDLRDDREADRAAAATASSTVAQARSGTAGMPASARMRLASPRRRRRGQRHRGSAIARARRHARRLAEAAHGGDGDDGARRVLEDQEAVLLVFPHLLARREAESTQSRSGMAREHRLQGRSFGAMVVARPSA
jgi:hypothetical protein